MKLTPFLSRLRMHLDRCTHAIQKTRNEQSYETALQCAPLESRMMMSATPLAIVAVALDSAEAANAADVGPADSTAANSDSTNDSFSQNATPAQTAELVIVDTSAENYQQLIDDIVNNADETRSFQVFTFDPDRDGIEQITELLSDYRDVDAIHIVSHGTDGNVRLGNATLNMNSLAAYAGQLGSWGDSLSSDGDILIYGCDLAASDSGQELVESLSILTAADVAASDDLTGHASLGGDWDLEFGVGIVQTNVAFSSGLQQQWVSLLAGSWFDADTGASQGGASNGADLFVGDGTDDTGINGLNGEDVMYGGGGADVLSGSGGNDLILGGDGNDSLYGENLSDILHGGLGDDLLDGGGSADILIGGGGNDTMIGGTSNDVFLFTGAQDGDIYTVDGEGDIDTIDVSEFVSASDSGTSMTVQLGGGSSFTINYVNVETVVKPGDAGNKAPNANAGLDQAVATGALVTLDASGSSDPDPDTLTYSWQQISGPWVTLSSQTAASPTFTAPGSVDVLEFAVVVDDGTISAVDTVRIVAGNPAIVLPSGPLNYNGGDPLSVIDGAATVADPDSPNFNTGQLTVTFTANSTVDDRLEIAAAGTISLQGSDIRWSPGGPKTTIGTWTGGTDGSTPLVITFNADADVAKIQDTMRAIGFRNVAASPSDLSRTVQFQLTDELGTASNTEVVTINMLGINAAPLNTVPGTQSTFEDTALSFNAGNSNLVSISDPDAGGGNIEVTLTATNGTVSVNLPYDPATATGPEFSLSSNNTGVQSETQVARLPDGRFVVVWSGPGPADSDGVWMRQFNADLTPVAGQIRLNANGAKADPQTQPTVAVNNSGRIVVAWRSNNQDAALTDGVYFRAMNWDGTSDTGELAANTNTSNDQFDPVVEIDSAGNVIVVWTDSSLDGHVEGLFARRFNSAGTAIDANEWQVATESDWKQTDASIAMHSSGQFVIAWTDSQLDGHQRGIFAKRYDATATPLDAPGTPGVPDFQVNVTTFKSQHTPSVAMDDSGNFVVIWTSQDQTGDGDDDGIFGQLYDAAGNKTGVTEFQVNTATTWNQTVPSVSMDATGNFVVAWEHWGTEFADKDIRFQQFDKMATKVGTEQIVNSPTTGEQNAPDVALDANGNFVIVWDGQTTTEADAGAVARHYDVPPPPLTFSVGDGVADNTTTFQGSIADINAALDGMVFNPTTSFVGTANVQIITSDLGNTGYGTAKLDSDTVNITVTSQPVGPISDTDATVSEVAEDATVGGTVGFTAFASDPDVANTVSYSLDNDAGGLFDINATTGVVTVKAALDFETAASHNIVVRATSTDTSSTTQGYTIIVTDVAATFTVSGGASVASGSSYTLNLNPVDPGLNSISNWMVNWGDGVIDTYVGNPASVTHTYTNTGFTNNILVSLTEASGTILQNELLVTSYGAGDSVFRYAPTTGAFLQEFATADGLNNPIDVIVGPDGNLYVSSEISDQVLRYNAVTGTFIDVFVAANAGGLNSPGGMAFGPDGNLYVSSYLTDEVLRFNGTTGASLGAFVTAASGGLDKPYGLAFGPDGNLYVNTYNNNSVLRFNGTTGASMGAFVTVGSGGLDTAKQMVFGPDGHLYVTSRVTNEVLRFNGTTGASMGAFVTAGLGTLDKPAGLAFGPDGHLYVSDYQNAAILRYHGTTGAFIDEYVTAGSGGLVSPAFINFLPAQQVTVTAAAAAGVPIDSVSDTNVASNEVAEYANVGDTVGITALAADVDVADTVSYSLDNDAGGLFDINTTTGVVTVKAALDYETAISHNIIVRAVSTDTTFSTRGFTINVTNVNEGHAGAVSVSGTPTEDQVLTASNSLTDPDVLGTISYQWQRNGVDISGETATTYTLDDIDVSRNIRVVAGYTDGGGFAESEVSTAVGPVAAVNDAPGGSVSISGTATEDQVLTASNTLTDADGLSPVSYQWQRNGIDITGETATTYTLVDADVGRNIRVVASYTDGQGFNESVNSPAVGPIANVNDAPGGGVNISGSPAEGSTLTANHTLTDDDGLGTVGYQWQRNGVNISGATGATYVLAPIDSGQMVRVVASYTDAQGTSESVNSAAVGPITNSNNSPTGTVTISGILAEDQTLTAANTLADLDGLGPITYQWQRGGADITGATSTTYSLTDADVGQLINVVASYTDGGSTPESVSSTTVGPVTNVNDAPGGSVNISGVPTEDQLLTASNTLTDADGTGTVSYQWQRNGSDISGAIATTYLLGDADSGQNIRVVASYTDGQGTSESVASTTIGPITNLNDLPIGTVTISGLAQEDQTLTGSNTLADADGLGPLICQWQRDGVDIVGETGMSYTLTQADVGAVITMVVGYTDGQGTAESVTSNSLGPVANVNDAPAGAVSMSGSPSEGSTLTAANTITDDDGLGPISYQWKRNGVDITGATSVTYLLAPVDVGSLMTVEASYTDGYGMNEAVLSTAVGPVTNVNNVPTGSVTISGIATEDETLTASDTLADADGLGLITYHWLRDGVHTGATGSSYVLGDADVGTLITVDAHYTDGGATNEIVVSTAVGAIANINDDPTITAIGDVIIAEDGATGSLAFSVSDIETAAGLLTVTASSSDTTLIPNASVVLNDLGGGNWTISAAGAIDQHGGPATITVSVNDGTSTVFETFDITINPVNDAPIISTVAAQNITEDVAVGATLITISATDVDTADTLNYALIAGNTDGAFTISATGEITVAAPLDSTTTPAYMLTVEVYDSGAPALNDTISVSITVTQVIAPAPVASSADEPSVTESDSDHESEVIETAMQAPAGLDSETQTATTSQGQASTSDSTTADDGIVGVVTAVVEDAEAVFIEAAIKTYLVNVVQSDVATAGSSGLARGSVVTQTRNNTTMEFATSDFSDDLFKMRGELNQTAGRQFYAAASAVGATGSLTVGYVLWALRGGWLVSSILAQMPAWQLVDPLMVLSSLTGDDELEDDQSLQDMLRNGVKETPDSLELETTP